MSKGFRHTLLATVGFDQLVTFQAVHAAGSFRRAADELGISQPAVSQRMKHLEALVGTALFDRHPGTGVELTQAGARLVEFADAALTELDSFHRDLQQLAAPNAGGAISVAAGPGFIKYRLLTLVEQFHARHPEIDVRLRQGSTPQQVAELVRGGTVDVGVHSGSAPEQFHRFQINDDEFVLVASPGHDLLQTPPRERLALLSRTAFAISPLSAHSRQLIERWAHSARVDLTITIETENLDTLKQAVVSGMAVAILPDFAVEAEIKGGDMVAVAMPGLPARRRVELITSRSRSLSAPTRHFIAAAEQMARGAPPSV